MREITRLAPNNELAEKKLSPDPLIHASSTVIRSRFGEYTEVEAGCFCNEISLGDYSYLSTSVRAIWCDIGKFSSIASHCVINPGNHPYERVTQSHCTYRCRQYGFAEQDDAAFFEWRKQDAVTIGHDVWLGQGARLLPGARLGHGVIVGAVAVVAGRVPDYAVVAGNPARVIRMRFGPEIVARLLEIAWWNWPIARILAHEAAICGADLAALERAARG